MRFPLILLGIALTACSGSVTEPVEEPLIDEVELDVVLDIRNNLVRHYGTAAAKAPVPIAEPQIRFDFLETSRMVTERGEAVVTGQFLLAIGGQDIRRGSIAVFFQLQQQRWMRTGDYEVLEEPVVSHVVDLQVKDALTGEPLVGAAVEALRIDDGVRSSRVEVTSEAGRARLEVLTGVFQLRATHESYRTALSDFMPVIEAHQEAALQLTPAKGGQPSF